MNSQDDDRMKKAMALSESFKSSGIMFVPMPVLDNVNDYDELAEEAAKRTYKIMIRKLFKNKQ